MNHQPAANENMDFVALQKEVEVLHREIQLLIKMNESSQQKLRAITPRESKNVLLRQGKRMMQHILIAVGNKRQLEARASTLLFQAIWDKNIGAVRRALQAGVDVNIPNAHGHIALERALNYPTTSEIAKLLIEAGADPNTKDHFNGTPLHLAVMMENVEVVRLLIEKGAKINEVDIWRFTPLHCATHGRESSIEIVRALLATGADVNARANYGHTPLHYATADRQEGIAELLIEHGADTNAKATWLKHHKHYNGHYDIIMLMHDLDDAPEEERRYDVTPAGMFLREVNRA